MTCGVYQQSRMHSAVSNLSKHFLCAVPVPSLNLEPVLEELGDEEKGLENQNALLSLTVKHPLVLLHPIKLAYQQLFLRTILKELENRGAEVCDLMYSSLCELLSTSGTSDTGFRHYVLVDKTIISIRESISLVTNGTTGLCTWQASQVLVNWCAHSLNKTLFQGARVLELGSGVGLSGLSISHLCQPDLYCFSDCHHAVLTALVSNIELNAKSRSQNMEVLPEIEDRILWQGTHGVSNLAVLNLPWEDVSTNNLGTVIAPDVVLAADVVYDSSIFESLSAALQQFAAAGSKIILACTKRNPETLKDFLNLLGSLDLSVNEEQVPETSVILSHNSSSVKIFSISSKKLNNF